MNIYKLSQDQYGSYDTYDSMVVVATTEDEARIMRPELATSEPWGKYYQYSAWATDPTLVKVELIGQTDKFDKPQVIVASFNAG